MFYLQLPSSSQLSTRPPSPSGGHNSDPEIDLNRGRIDGDATPSFKKRILPANLEDADEHDHHERGRRRHEREPSKTAGWQDFVKFVLYTVSAPPLLTVTRLTTLQAVIADTKQSLSDIERQVEQFILRDETLILVSC